MPIILRIDGFKFLFYGNEGNPREPVHIHVKLGRDEAKILAITECGVSI